MSRLLDEAQRIVNGDRMKHYGHPLDNFTQTAELWNATFGTNFTYRDVALAMIQVKISRETNAPTMDNLTDIIGYVFALDLADKEVERRRDEGFSIDSGTVTITRGRPDDTIVMPFDSFSKNFPDDE